MNKKKIFLCILFALYICVILKITVFRSSFSLHNPAHGTLNLRLFGDLFAVLKTDGIFTFLYLFLGNIGWFVPFGAFFPLVGSKLNILKICLLGGAFSILIETLQYIFGVGVSEIDDVILNITGVLLGAVISEYILKKKECEA